jgi:hypothetical protein
MAFSCYAHVVQAVSTVYATTPNCANLSFFCDQVARLVNVAVFYLCRWSDSYGFVGNVLSRHELF